LWGFFNLPSFTPHPTGEDLTLHDLVDRSPRDLSRPREQAPAARASKIPGCAILDDPFNETFDQSAGAALAIAVEQRAAATAVDRNRAASGIILGHTAVLLN
jgi:hypothetical protein